MGNITTKEEKVWAKDDEDNIDFSNLPIVSDSDNTFLFPFVNDHKNNNNIEDLEQIQINNLNDISKSEFCTTVIEHKKEKEEPKSPKSKYSMPDWREFSKLLWDPINRIELLHLPVGTILFKGMSINNASQELSPSSNVPNGYYGTINTVFRYAFETWEAYDSGTITCYMVTRPINVVYINSRNLINLLNFDAKDPHSTPQEKENLLNLMLYMFGLRVHDPYNLSSSSDNKIEKDKKFELENRMTFVEDKNELRRNSTTSEDFIFLNWLCQRQFQGYGYRRMLDKSGKNFFHSEIALCDANQFIKKLPIEWRMFEDYPECLFQFQLDSLSVSPKLVKILDASEFGSLGYSPQHFRIRGPLPPSVQEFKNEIDNYKNKTTGLCNCMKDINLKSNLNDRIRYSQSSPLLLQTRKFNDYEFGGALTLFPWDDDDRWNDIRPPMVTANNDSDEARTIIVQMHDLPINIKKWNIDVTNALNHSYHLIPKHHSVESQLLKAWNKYIDINKTNGISDPLFFVRSPSSKMILFTIMTWNIKYWANERVETKNEKIKIILQFLPDILCLQEVSKKRIPEISHALKEFKYPPEWIIFCSPLSAKRQKSTDTEEELVNVIFIRNNNTMIYPTIKTFSNYEDLRRLKQDKLYDYDQLDNQIDINELKDERNMTTTNSPSDSRSRWRSSRVYSSPVPQAIDLFHGSYGQEGRCAVYRKIGPFWIFNLHLDVYDSTNFTRIKQIEDVLTIVNTLPIGEPVMIMGDFNSIRKQDIVDASSSDHATWLLKDRSPYGMHRITDQSFIALDRLETVGGFKDVSDIIGIHIPVTVWTGTRVDFIFVKNIPREQILSTFTIFTNASDHLPLIAQFILLSPPITTIPSLLPSTLEKSSLGHQKPKSQIQINTKRRRKEK